MGVASFRLFRPIEWDVVIDSGALELCGARGEAVKQERGVVDTTVDVAVYHKARKPDPLLNMIDIQKRYYSCAIWYATLRTTFDTDLVPLFP